MPPPPRGVVPRPQAPAPGVPRVPVVPPVSAQVPPPVAAAGWKDEDDASQTPFPEIEIRRKVVYRKQSSGSGVLLALTAALTAAAGALYVFKFRPELLGVKKAAVVARVDPAEEPEPAPEPAPRPKPMAKPRTKPARERPAAPAAEPRPEPAPPPAPAADASPRPVPAPEPAEDTVRLESLLAEVRQALGGSGFAAARTAVDEAASVATSTPSRERVARWAELVAFAKGFAEYREQALAAVKSGDEYDIEGKKIGVVEIDAEKFVYRRAGKNRTTPRNRIPGGILMAIVTEWFDDNPANDLYIGAYHATKAEPDLDKAREAWQGAQGRGADASLLLPLLDDPILTKAGDAGQAEQ